MMMFLVTAAATASDDPINFLENTFSVACFAFSGQLLIFFEVVPFYVKLFPRCSFAAFLTTANDC